MVLAFAKWLPRFNNYISTSGVAALATVRCLDVPSHGTLHCKSDQKADWSQGEILHYAEEGLSVVHPPEGFERNQVIIIIIIIIIIIRNLFYCSVGI
jgi:hypothetical protein